MPTLVMKNVIGWRSALAGGGAFAGVCANAK
jgi:hypothetical protein